MKPPKRKNGNSYGAAYCPYEGPTQAAFEHARWKRKNRIAQYKHKISKLTAENKWLSAERKKYIEYHYNALMALAKMREELIRKEQSKR